jgi:hypothetical protein
MYNHVNPKNDQPSPLIAEDVYNIIMEVSAGSAASGRTCCNSCLRCLGCSHVLLSSQQQRPIVI